jgi:hypothetical protein
MPDTPVDLSPFRAACEAVVTGGAEIFHWEWDGRLRAALAAFPRRHAARAHAVLGQSFAHCCTSASLDGATPRLREIASALGGLWAGQELFVSEPQPALVLCASWWPWGDGETISVRIRLLANGAPPTEESGLLAELRRWFALESGR